MTAQLTYAFSILRILATLGIFAFHCLEFMHMDKMHLDYISIIIFCFLTGVLAYDPQERPLSWLWRRLTAILIPYWFVIINIICLNRVIHYKETTIANDIITILFGNWFIENPVYVPAWYITFICIVYLFIFLTYFTKTNLQRICLWTLGAAAAGLSLDEPAYFAALTAGFFMRNIFSLDKTMLKEAARRRPALFYLQKQCYAFFLVHGGVLLFLTRFLHLEGWRMILPGLLISSIAAVILTKISTPLIRSASRLPQFSTQPS